MKLEDLIRERDLVIFDLETTGTNPREDRIVQFAAVRIFADGRGRETLELKINPGRPIPPSASKIHGITDDVVRNAPRFPRVANRILAFMRDADVGGYNVLSFDLPLLRNELARVKRDLDVKNLRIVDGMLIFKLYEKRSLEAAVQFYCDREHENSHDALGDVLGTIDVIQAQLDRYEDLPREMDGLTRKLLGRRVTLDGRIVWQDGKPCIGFGKHAGVPLQVMARQHRDYLEWILDSDFPADVKAVIRAGLGGRFPEPE